MLSRRDRSSRNNTVGPVALPPRTWCGRLTRIMLWKKIARSWSNRVVAWCAPQQQLMAQHLPTHLYDLRGNAAQRTDG